MENDRSIQHKIEERAMQAAPQEPPQWMAALDERTNKHIVYARTYAREFAHGAPGHLDLMTIAALAELLDQCESNGTLQKIARLT